MNLLKPAGYAVVLTALLLPAALFSDTNALPTDPALQSGPTNTPGRIVERRGKGKVRLVKYGNGHWQMIVNGKPFVVKGVSYAPTPLGERGSHDWMFRDANTNGLIDAPQEAFMDANRNNRRDPDEPAVGDFRILKDMGCNAVRHYHVSPNNDYSPDEYNKPLLRDMATNIGIFMIMGDFAGAYTIGSGADWQTGTDYRDPEQTQLMKSVISNFVLDHRKEPYVLFWLIGNENNMSSGYTGINTTRTLAANYPEAYARFLNDVAKMIHRLDPDHPVAVGNVGLGLLEYYAQFAPELDILGINDYPGKFGFTHLWKTARKKFDRPIVITEYGSDAYNTAKNEPDEKGQAAWHKGQWEDIARNLAGGPREGNALGGVAFEYLDEWWKSLLGGVDTQQNTVDTRLPFPDGVSSEEWLGLFGQGDGSLSPFLRQKRLVVDYYRNAWNADTSPSTN